MVHVSSNARITDDQALACRFVCKRCLAPLVLVRCWLSCQVSLSTVAHTKLLRRDADPTEDTKVTRQAVGKNDLDEVKNKRGSPRKSKTLPSFDPDELFSV